MATEQEPTHLGKDVERAIEEFWLNCQQHGDPKKLAMADCAPCRIAKGFLESAIRARIEDRPSPPEPDPAHLPHECWCKESADGHSQCFKVGRHRCGCGATRPYRYEGMPGYDVRYDFWSGGLSGRPDARAPQVAAIEDEAKPQHTFTRRHVSDLREVPQGVEHTSEHSAGRSEQIRQHVRKLGIILAELEALASEYSAVRAIMDTSPENLLKLERLSNTVYVCLGHRDPDKLAAWIHSALDIAGKAAGL